ncbi:MAG: hypothetical protein HKP40_01800, partial [Litoreibacter sp.]|nr:hypothetical protein [Litoreibacter sp.]
LDEDGNCRPDSLAARLMDEVGQAVPILPVPLVCYVLEQAGHRITRGDLQQQFESLLQQISPGVSVCLPGAGPENAVAEGLRMLEARGVVDRDGEEIAVTDRYPELIGFYAASIQQYMSDIKLQKP